MLLLLLLLCPAVSEEGDDELQALLQNFSTGADSADGYEQPPQPSQVRAGNQDTGQFSQRVPAEVSACVVCLCDPFGPC